ncbi:cytochrome P450 [Cryomyces antarcticus]
MFLFTLGTFPLGFRRGYPTDLVAAADDLQADIQLEPSHRALRSKARVRNPPIVPYSIPFVGNLFAFAFDTAGFIASLSKRFGDYIPCRVRVANQTIHIISGPEHINTLFKNSRDLTTKPSAVLVVENAFGAGLAELATRFMANLAQQLNANDDIGYEEWVELPDLYSFLQLEVFNASMNALCGDHFFKLNPDFAADFWEFDKRTPGLFKSLPRWLIPRSYQIRDKLHGCMLTWQNYADEHFDWTDETAEGKEWEPFFGAKIMRQRHQMFAGVEGLSKESAAANNLGMVWATNANVIPTAGWMLLDILLRPSVLSKVRSEIAPALIHSGTSSTLSFDMPQLLVNPLLQSIYSEELRMRVGVMIQRVPLVSNFRIGQWLFPRGKMIVASHWHAARDKKIWNEGTDKDPHPVDDFWAERFLVYPDDPESGPAKSTSTAAMPKRERTGDQRPQPVFTTDPVIGSFIPYGGGVKICPGRFFAKQEMLGTVALMLTVYDIELKLDGKAVEPDMNYFPFGGVPPRGKIPARIRRRRV